MFGAIGPLKRANLLQRGQAEVAFIHKEHAILAVKNYHNRELDGKSDLLHNSSFTKTHDIVDIKSYHSRELDKLFIHKEHDDWLLRTVVNFLVR